MFVGGVYLCWCVPLFFSVSLHPLKVDNRNSLFLPLVTISWDKVCQDHARMEATHQLNLLTEVMSSGQTCRPCVRPIRDVMHLWKQELKIKSVCIYLEISFEKVTLGVHQGSLKFLSEGHINYYTTIRGPDILRNVIVSGYVRFYHIYRHKCFVNTVYYFSIIDKISSRAGWDGFVCRSLTVPAPIHCDLL